MADELQSGIINGELYIVKDGETFRIVVDERRMILKIEKLKENIFQPSGLELDATTLHLGLDISLSTQGSQLRIESREVGTCEMTIGSEFDDSGAGPAKVAIMSPRLNRLIVNSNTTGELVTRLRENTFTGGLAPSLNKAFRYKFYFKTGSIAATKPVTLEISQGFAPGGEVIFRTVMPPSQWPANSEVIVELGGGLNISPGKEFLSSLFSDADYSLVGGTAEGGQFFGFDVQSYFFEALVSVPHGTDRFLIDDNNELIIDNNGNMTLSGMDVASGELHSHSI